MAINQNHLFEELDGVKCGIVEKLVPPARVEFLRRVLEYNGYTVKVVPSPPAKGAAAAKPPVAAAGEQTAGEKPAAEGATEPAEKPAVVEPETFTVGVTDTTFNPINAIFGRLLKAPGGHVVTLGYWQQKDGEPRDEVPYFNK